jgi:GAF domain-containing protein
MAGKRRQMQVADLARLSKALERCEQPPAIYRMIDEIGAEVIGHQLFTIMRLVPDEVEVERVYTNVPNVYPVGGRKKKTDTPWARHVLEAMKVFRADCPDDIRAAFDDHQTILRLGIGSILNVPVVFNQRCLGTVIFCHQTGWYNEEDEAVARVLATFLIAPLREV